MSLQSFIAALIAGVSAFVVVAVAVTELTAPTIAFSLLAGIPAGLIAGAVVAIGVYAIHDEAAPARSQRVAGGMMGFAAGFLLAFFVGSTVLELGVLFATGAATVIGLVVAVAALLRR